MNPALIDYYYRRGGGASFTSEYQAVLDYATTQGWALPGATVQTAQNNYVSTLISLGIWDAFDILYITFTDGDSDFACLNWKSPGSYTLLKVNSPTFSSLGGFTGGGSSYLSTQFVYSNGVGIKTSTPHAMTSVNTEPTDIGTGIKYTIGGITSGPTTRTLDLGYDFGANRISYAMTSSNFLNSNSDTVLNFLGMFLTQRNGTTASVYKNGVQLTQSSTTFTAVTPTDITLLLLCRNNGGTPATFIDARLECASVGGNMGGNELNLYNSWNDYKTAAAA